MIIQFFKKLFSGPAIDPEIEAIVKKGAKLVDVRTRLEFSRGSVDNAINIPLSEIKSRAQELKEETDIVVFCRSGNRSGNALKILEGQGIKGVVNGGSVGQVRKMLGEE